MKEQNPLDEYFRKGLEGHETKPSASVWDKIEKATESQSSSRGAGWYFMRAAMVTVLIGLSTWVFYQNQDFYDSGEGFIPVEETPVVINNKEPGTEEKSRKDLKKEEPASGAQKEKKESTRESDKQNKVVPIMKQPAAKSIYVNNDQAVPEVIDEEVLATENQQWQPMEIALNVPAETANEVTPVKVRVKLKPATTPAFYANQGEEEDRSGFKEKLYAYANTQFDNLLSGKPLELPKTEKKPQLEINLGRIFNN